MQTTLLVLTLLAAPAWASRPAELQWGWGSSPAQVQQQVQQLGWEQLRPLQKTADSGHLSQMSFRLPQSLRGSESIRTCIFRDNRLVRVYLLTRGIGAKTMVCLFNTTYRQLTPTAWVDPSSGTRVDQALLNDNQVFTVSPG
ncbi:hypothetical protein GKZ68_16975 [Hymenobacter sp. BRD128]|uniref:hypothetical protein n=1 Tax=Hymenobacter sp. BRD128 TaxID=2675878 RepID=UPI0015632135|nr:hypothetical protein [Hymenobacter sp. BRD128]QKG58170.1 hypothetical protein GKZ68_16975 [Hymenobacter sp. BRD128]